MINPDRQAVIVEAVRTPFGRRKGALADWHPVNLAAFTMEQLVKRSGIAPGDVEHVILGCVSQIGEQSLNIARNTALRAGLPMEIPATTIDFQCGSSQQAVHLAAMSILSGEADIVIAGGIESMTRVPLGSSFSDEHNPNPPELLAMYDIVNQGFSAQRVADKYGIKRSEMDAYAVRSHQLAQAATVAGKFVGEIVPVPLNDNRVLDRDEGIRANASFEAVSDLQPVFSPDHAITAGNASQITDGASMILVMSAARAKAMGLKPKARIGEFLVVGSDPSTMLEGPIPATVAILKKTGKSIDDINLFEVNEAFAAIPLSWLKATEANPDRMNVNGGAIALGHPVGASGARLIATLIGELERRNLHTGLVTMCCGGGLGTATLIERI